MKKYSGSNLFLDKSKRLSQTEQQEYVRKRWLLLGVGLFLYLIFGALMFSAIEQPYASKLCVKTRLSLNETMVEFVRLSLSSRTSTNYSLVDDLNKDNSTNKNSTDPVILQSISRSPTPIPQNVAAANFPTSEKDLINFIYNFTTQASTEWQNYYGNKCHQSHTDNHKDHGAWSFTHALFYSFTVLTTIGYGSMSPRSDWGKIATVTYSIMGFGIAGAFMQIVSYRIKLSLNQSFNKRYVKYSPHIRRSVIIVMFVLVYIMLPALMFYFVENRFLQKKDWTFMTCIYFVIITLGLWGNAKS